MWKDAAMMHAAIYEGPSARFIILLPDTYKRFRDPAFSLSLHVALPRESCANYLSSLRG
jgi:hypothetical protein